MTLHVRQAGLLIDRAYPGARRPIPLAPTPVDLSETPGLSGTVRPRRASTPKRLFGELGYSAQDIRALRDKRVV
jgi:hypothetical protein